MVMRKLTQPVKTLCDKVFFLDFLCSDSLLLKKIPIKKVVKAFIEFLQAQYRYLS